VQFSVSFEQSYLQHLVQLFFVVYVFSVVQETLNIKKKCLQKVKFPVMEGKNTSALLCM
jgi:hypothetical protein